MSYLMKMEFGNFGRQKCTPISIETQLCLLIEGTNHLLEKKVSHLKEETNIPCRSSLERVCGHAYIKNQNGIKINKCQ